MQINDIMNSHRQECCAVLRSMAQKIQNECDYSRKMQHYCAVRPTALLTFDRAIELLNRN